MKSPSKPLMPNIGIIALPYHKWSYRWMTPHHVLTRLARYFNVVWVNPAHSWREIPSKMRHHDERFKIDSTPGFCVYAPEFWLPMLHRPPWLSDFTFVQRLKRARNKLVRCGNKKVVLYLWHPQFERALSSIPFDLSCYHIDDEYSFSNVELPQDKTEARLIAAVDQVFAISPGLLERKGGINPHTAFSPEGVDFEAYSKPVPEPGDIAPIPRPRIGYTGVLKKQLDWPLILSLALEHPEWSYVFVGPKAPHPEIDVYIQKLSALSNVYFLGAKSVDDLAAYPQHFDVCIMPYKLDAYTKYIYPLKLHEYLASGSPVVASPIRSLQDFDHVIMLAQTNEEWSTGLSMSLRPEASNDAQVETRHNLARKHDWRVLVGSIARTVCGRLGATYLDQFDKLLV